MCPLLYRTLSGSNVPRRSLRRLRPVWRATEKYGLVRSSHIRMEAYSFLARYLGYGRRIKAVGSIQRNQVLVLGQRR